MPDVPRHRSRWQLQENETFRVRFRVLEPERGRVVLATRAGVDPRAVEHWVEFRLWDFETMVRLRKEATRYHPESRSFYVDQDSLNDVKLRHLLAAWSFGEQDPHLVLQHQDGRLTDEALALVKSLYPWVAVAIITKMNEVLEGLDDGG